MLLDQQTKTSNQNDPSGERKLETEAAPTKEPFEDYARKVKFLLNNGMISKEQYQEKLAQQMHAQRFADVQTAYV